MFSQFNFGNSPATGNTDGIKRDGNETGGGGVFGQNLFNGAVNNTGAFGIPSIGKNEQNSAFSFRTGMQNNLQNSLYQNPAQQQQSGRIFGQIGGMDQNSGFGFGQNNLQRPFGAGANNTMGFGQGITGNNTMNPFGMTQGGAFNSANQDITTTEVNSGTGNPYYRIVTVPDPSSPDLVHKIVHICACEPYSAWSIEELRWKDYQMNRKPNYLKQNRIGSYGFGMNNQNNQQSGLGIRNMGSNVFGQNNTVQNVNNTGTNMPFGTNQQTPFGQSNNNTNLFSGFGKPSIQPVGGTSLPFNNQIGNSTNTNTMQQSAFGANQNTLGSSFLSFDSSQSSFQNPKPQTDNTQLRTGNTPVSWFGQSTAPQTTSIFGSTPQVSTGLQTASPFGNFQQNQANQNTQYNSNSQLRSTVAPTSFLGSTLGATSKPPDPGFNLGSNNQSSFLNTAPKFDTGQLGSNPSTAIKPFSWPQTNQLQPTAATQTLQVPKPPGTSLFNPKPTTMFGFNSQPANTTNLFPQTNTNLFNTLNYQQQNIMPSIDKSPYGKFNVESFPKVKITTENKPKEAETPSRTVGQDRLISSKMAERYFSNVKIYDKNKTRGQNKLSLHYPSTPSSSYPFLSLKSDYSLSSRNNRLFIEGLNAAKSENQDKEYDKIFGDLEKDSNFKFTDTEVLLKNSFNIPKPTVKVFENPVDDFTSDDNLPFESEMILPDGTKQKLYRPIFDPPVSKLANMTDIQLKKIKNFKISSPEVGSITYLEDVNIFDLLDPINTVELYKKLNSIVKFMYRVISVYPEGTLKPQRGKGLNLKAEILLKNCYPKTKSQGKDLESSLSYDSHIKFLKNAKGTQFVSYDDNGGLWKFRVDHFTTYGFKEEESKVGLLSEDEPKSEKKEDSRPNTPPSEEVTKKSNVTKRKLERKEDPPKLLRKESIDTNDELSGDLFYKTAEISSSGSTIKISDNDKHKTTPKVSRSNDIFPRNNGISSAFLQTPLANEGPKCASSFSELTCLNTDLPRDDDSVKNPGSLYIECKEVLIDDSYSHKLRGNVIDLISANRGMFRPCWNPSGGLFVTLVAGQNGISNKFTIKKVNLFENVEAPLNPNTSLKMYESIFNVLIANTIFLPLQNDKLIPEPQSPKAEKPEITKISSRTSSSMETTMSVNSTVSRSYNNGYSGNDLHSKLIPHAKIKKIEFKYFSKEISQKIKSETSLTYSNILDILYLGSALWDPLPTEIDNLESEKHLYIEEGIRKGNVSKWLKELMKPIVEERLSVAQGPTECIFSCLIGGQLSRAINFALKARYYRLSALLTQICGTMSLKLSNELPSNIFAERDTNILDVESYCLRGVDVNVSRCISNQIRSWTGDESNGVKRLNSYIDPNIVRLWTLCSGDISLWDKKIISSANDWKNLYAMFLWYGGMFSCTLSQALQNYENSFRTYSDVLPPIPRFVKKSNGNEALLDPAYYLLRLYSKMQDNIEEAFKVKGVYSENPLECLIPWITCIVLITRKESNNCNSLNENREIQSLKKVFESLTISLIFMLEGIGLWKYSVYVALFLQKIESRKAIVMHILSQNYPVNDGSGSMFSNLNSGIERPTASIFGESQKTPYKDSEIYKFLTINLSIPSSWIHEVRALKSFYENDSLTFITAQIDAGKILSAYQTIIPSLFTRSIISGQLSTVNNILIVLENLTESSKVKSGIIFLMKCIATVEAAQNFKKDGGNAEVFNSAESILDDLKQMIDVFSNRGALESEIGITPMHSNCAFFRAVSLKFSTHPPKNVSRFISLKEESHKEKLDLGICWSIIFEECFDFFVEVQKRATHNNGAKKAYKVCSDILTYFLPLFAEERILKLRNLVTDLKFAA